MRTMIRKAPIVFRRTRPLSVRKFWCVRRVPAVPGAAYLLTDGARPASRRSAWCRFNRLQGPACFPFPNPRFRSRSRGGRVPYRSDVSHHPRLIFIPIVGICRGTKLPARCNGGAIPPMRLLISYVRATKITRNKTHRRPKPTVRGCRNHYGRFAWDLFAIYSRPTPIGPDNGVLLSCCGQYNPCGRPAGEYHVWSARPGCSRKRPGLNGRSLLVDAIDDHCKQITNQRS